MVKISSGHPKEICSGVDNRYEKSSSHCTGAKEYKYRLRNKLKELGIKREESDCDVHEKLKPSTCYFIG